MGRSGAGARRQGRCDGTQHGIAGRPGRALRRRPVAHPAGRHRPERGLRRGQAGARPLRASRHCREQRGLRPVRVHRGTLPARGARSDRDECLWGAVDHPGRAAVPARAGQRAHHPGVLDRGHHGVPVGRHVSRVEVGAGRVFAGAGAGGRPVRRARHADRAGRLRHRLGRGLGEARRSAAGIRRRSRRRAGRAQQAVGQPGKSGGLSGRACCGWSTPRSRRCECFSARLRWRRPRQTTRAGSAPGRSGSPSRSSRRADRRFTRPVRTAWRTSAGG